MKPSIWTLVVLSLAGATTDTCDNCAGGEIPTETPTETAVETPTPFPTATPTETSPAPTPTPGALYCPSDARDIQLEPITSWSFGGGGPLTVIDGLANLDDEDGELLLSVQIWEEGHDGPSCTYPAKVTLEGVGVDEWEVVGVVSDGVQACPEFAPWQPPMAAIVGGSVVWRDCRPPSIPPAILTDWWDAEGDLYLTWQAGSASQADDFDYPAGLWDLYGTYIYEEGRVGWEADMQVASATAGGAWDAGQAEIRVTVDGRDLTPAIMPCQSRKTDAEGAPHCDGPTLRTNCQPEASFDPDDALEYLPADWLGLLSNHIECAQNAGEGDDVPVWWFGLNDEHPTSEWSIGFCAVPSGTAPPPGGLCGGGS